MWTLVKVTASPWNLQGKSQSSKYATLILPTPAGFLPGLPINQSQTKARGEGSPICMIHAGQSSGIQSSVAHGYKR